MRRSISFIGILVILASVTLSCKTLVSTPSNPSSIPPAVTMVAQSVEPAVKLPPVPDIISAQDQLVSLYDQVHDGVVSIQVLLPEGAAQGSGFVFDQDGHIVTNYHVVENETELEVSFLSGLRVRGKVVGTDPDSDLAVIKVDVPSSELHPLTLGNSDQVKVGQAVIAIGNPFGLEGTMTTGIVSGKGRTVQSLRTTSDGGVYSVGDIIQTDAAINPGNSGGPLLNLNGEVVGVNESIRTSSFNTGGQPTNSGVGFAISSDIVRRVTPDLIAHGKYDYPYVGITSLSTDQLQSIMPLDLMDALGLKRSTGVYVTSVVPGAAADRAGIKAGTKETSIPNLLSGGDLIISLDSQPVLTFDDFITYLVKFKKPGDTIVVTVLRGDQEVNLNLTLDKRP
jgi:S1-C subfamily serine protease